MNAISLRVYTRTASFQTALVFYLFLFLLVISGCQAIPSEPQNLEELSQPGLWIQFSPVGALVQINDEPAGQTPLSATYSPGDVLRVQITHESYLPYEGIISIPPSGDLILKGSLVPRVVKQRVASSGSHLVWVDGAICYFSGNRDSDFFCFKNGENYLLSTFDQLPNWVRLHNEIFYLQILDENGPVVISFDPESQKINKVIRGLFVAEQAKNLEEFYLFGLHEFEPGFFEETLKLFVLAEDGEPNQIDLATSPGEAFASDFSVSADGDWIVTSVLGEVMLWNLSEVGFVFQSHLEDVAFAKFSPNKNNGMGSINREGTLELIDIELLNRKLISRNVTSFTWMPDGKQILYARTSNEGSSTLWMTNLESNISRMVADAGIILGEVVNLQVSPDGTLVAYLNHQGRIEMLNLWVAEER
jgi:WD40 repeat protein